VAQRRTYDVSIAGRLHELADAFAPHVVRTENGHSVVRAVDVDQAALFGVIGRVQAHGLELLEVRIVGS
jgi:hypothetical protein